MIKSAYKLPRPVPMWWLDCVGIPCERCGFVNAMTLDRFLQPGPLFCARCGDELVNGGIESGLYALDLL